MAQYEHLLHKTFPQRWQAIVQLSAQAAGAPDTEQGWQIVRSFQVFAEQSGDVELEVEAKLLSAYYLSLKDTSRQKVIAALESVVAEATRKGTVQSKARALKTLGDYYWQTVENYELAFENYIALSATLEALPDTAYPDKLFNFILIANAYYRFGEYREVINLLLKAVKITVTDNNRINYFDAQNTLGLCYQKLGLLDSADYWFERVINSRQILPDGVWQNIARGNLGYSHFLRGRYDAAIPLLEADIAGAIEIQDWGLASGSLMPLATIYLQRGEIAKAEGLTLQAVDYVRRSGQTNRYLKLYPLLAKLYAAKGNAVLAAQYVDSTLFIRDSLDHQFSVLQPLRAQQKIELQQQKAAQESLAYEKRLKVMERDALLAIAGLLMALLGYVYYATRRKLQQEQQLKTMQLREKENELELASVQLHEFAQSIQEKNRLLEVLEQQFGAAGNDAILQELRQSTILTNADWEKFRSLFEQVHIGFLDRLRCRFPHLTPAEIRFMVLSRLHFSNKEMAAALGVSPQTVRTIWYRIRKKHHLPEEAVHEELAGSI